jgi:predicted nucleotidyltransferase
MNEKDRQIVFELRNRLTDDVLKHLKRLVLFGSRAKGEETADSDLDILAIVDEKNTEIEKRLEDIAYQVMWDNDFKPIISLKVLAESHFLNALNKGYSFYRHVEREGITV